MLHHQSGVGPPGKYRLNGYVSNEERLTQSNNTGDAKIEGYKIEVFKILNGHENIDGKSTRGHDFTLEKMQSRFNVRKYYFFPKDRKRMEEIVS